MKNSNYLLHFLLTLSVLFGATLPASATPASDTWTGLGANPNWSAPLNWTGGNAPPLAGDSLLFDGSTQTGSTNDLTAGSAFNGLTFNPGASPFTLGGNSLLLSGSMAGNGLGVANNSPNLQTISLNLAVDRGTYTFSSPSATLALNGSLTLNPGAVAYFEGTVTSTSLAQDGVTGLISGLQGGALIDSAGVPSGLATITGGVISAYSGYTSVAAGGIGNGNNLNLTASGAAAAYTANNNTVNTISTAQVGNSTGTFTDTLTTTGTLTLGDKGGVYVLNSGAGNKSILNLAGGTITAGAGPTATLIFGVNGTTTGNQLAVNSKITNNAAAGAVSVVTTGPGSLFFAVANSYSGGTYVNQGQLQANNIGAFGSGPVNIASGATVLLNQAGTWANNISLSPGSGSPLTGLTAATGAGSLELNNSDTFSGILTLMGPAVTASPGDRITPNITSGTETFTGQITGTGTLEIFGYHTATIIFQNANAINTNNWQGGLIIGGKPGVAVNLFVKMGAANQIPSGANAGDVTLIPATAAVQSRFDLNGFNTTINGLVGTSANAAAQAQLTSFGTANCTLTLGAGNPTATFNGTVSDSGAGKTLSLNKIGTGTQTFAGAMTHNGTTTVSAGNLTLTGNANPLNSPVITVASGATLDASTLNTGGLTVGANQTLAGLGTVIGSTAINGKVNPSLTTVGTLTNNGTVAFNGGGSYVWNINNATGTAGTDSGWSLLNILNGSLAINANSGSPFTIKITSLTPADVAGNAANFNANSTRSWTIAQGTSPISGFTPSAFTLDTSAFANPKGSGAFSIGLSPDQMSLVLTFTSTPTITTPLVSRTNNAGTAATFTVVANGATTPVTFQWLQGSTVLNNGDTTPSGATVTITSSGHTCTLTIGGTGVQDADAGGYTVNVSDNFGAQGTSSASLTVIDPPVSPNVVQSPGTIISAGGVYYFTATASGTGPFTYVWSKNGQPLVDGGHISGANTATLAVDASSADVGSYTVTISNSAGTVQSAASVIGPVTSVPGQIVYDPFTSYAAQTFRPPSDTWEGVTNLFNQITGEPAWWFHSSGSGIQMIVQANDIGNGVNNANGGSYPWPGLAGNSANCLYWTTSANNHLRFEQNGFTNGNTVYVSFILSCDSLGTVNGISDVLAGLVSANDGTAFNLKISSQIVNAAANQYVLGLSKGNGRTGAQGVDANTLWSSTTLMNQQAVLVVACYTVNSGGTTNTDDTVSMWINPSPSTFYASGTNVPPPDLGPSNFGVTNSAIRDFAVHAVVAPASHRIADLRIGTTWASATPPSAPTLSLANVSTTAGANAVFASQNAGNPVDSYQWRFNGGPVLVDNAHISGATTATLTIIGAQPADAGTYTVTGTNTDPLNSNTLTGSASATLTLGKPVLGVAYNGSNVLVSWSTNFPGYLLEQTSALSSPGNWITNTSPVVVSGTNNTVTINAAAGNAFFRLIK